MGSMVRTSGQTQSNTPFAANSQGRFKHYSAITKTLYINSSLQDCREEPRTYARTLCTWGHTCTFSTHTHTHTYMTHSLALFKCVKTAHCTAACHTLSSCTTAIVMLFFFSCGVLVCPKRSRTEVLSSRRFKRSNHVHGFLCCLARRAVPVEPRRKGSWHQTEFI